MPIDFTKKAKQGCTREHDRPVKQLDICNSLSNRRHHLWKKIRRSNSINTKIAALDIVSELPSGPNMQDLMRMTNLVMMAEPEGFVATEKGKNRARSKFNWP